MISRRRVRRRIAALAGPGRRGPGGTPRPLRDPLVAVGRATSWVVGCLGFPAVVDDGPSVNRLRGGVVVVAVLIAGVAPLLAGVVGVVGWQVPRLVAVRRRSQLERALVDETLLATELCAVAVHTGTTVPQTVEVVAAHLDGPLGARLDAAVRGYRHGVLLDEGLAGVVDELGDAVAPLVTILRAAHADGDPIEPALHRLADRLRAERRRQVETEVRRLSVRLLIPLVCCSLPGFVLVAVVPLVLGSLGGLGH